MPLSPSVDQSTSAGLQAEAARPSPLAGSRQPQTTGGPCHHCGTSCPDDRFASGEKLFCCHGCKTVYELLIENGLGHFYDLGDRAGIRVRPVGDTDRFQFLDDPMVRDRLLDFTDGRIAKVTFQIPAMHCIACVWLLENLFQLRAGIGRSVVNFPRRECAITFEPAKIKLSEIAGLLTSLGYEPSFNLATPDQPRSDPASRRLWLRLGVAGFAFGNTMLISVASYLGLNSADQPGLKLLLGWLSLALALPVFIYSASDYWRASWFALRQKLITLELPIAAGLVALFAQSSYEVVSGRGDGYFDSLTGLVFFLLCGRLFQHKTYDRLTFDRDYRSFFPLSVRRRSQGREESVTLSRIQVGDRLILRHGELVPADARVIEGHAVIDYSFVTGESAPVEKGPGDHLYAGGRQVGATLEVETVKAVSESYLTSLWGDEAFRKNTHSALDTLTNRFSRRFTVAVILVAVGAAAFWAWNDDPARGLKAFVSVLIVACPCALALAAPFALGTAQRWLGRSRIFLRNPHVLEALSRIDSVVFDKTGTLTAPEASTVTFHGRPLGPSDRQDLLALATPSTHPYARRIVAAIAANDLASGAGLASDDRQGATDTNSPPAAVSEYRELPGQGIEGSLGGRRFWLGARAWLESRGVSVPSDALPRVGATHLAVDGVYRGRFEFASMIRPQTGSMLGELGDRYELALLSGDTAGDRDRFRSWFKSEAQVAFNQSPMNKLAFVRGLQSSGKTVMMVGDGLNDAGALKQSDVGVAVVEDVGAFSPASDVILGAAEVPRLPHVLSYSRETVRVVRASFAISTAYNVLGLSIAASGRLSPLVCAVLMPLSSFTVVTFACVATAWLGRRRGFSGKPAGEAA